MALAIVDWDGEQRWYLYKFEAANIALLLNHCVPKSDKVHALFFVLLLLYFVLGHSVSRGL